MQAAERLRTGEIGDFIGIDISLSTPAAYMTLRKDHWAHRLPGGVVGETGPHAVYLALSFLKQVHGAEVQARKVLPKCPWSRFEDFRINLIGVNGIASIKLIYASDQWAASLDIIGTKGRLVVDLEAQSVIRYDRCRLDPVSIGLSKLADGSQKLVSLMSNGLKEILGLREDCHAIGIRRFLESVLKAKQPPVTAYDAREVVRVTRMIVEKLPEAAG
jgi:predicted dehydrogenase